MAAIKYIVCIESDDKFSRSVLRLMYNSIPTIEQFHKVRTVEEGIEIINHQQVDLVLVEISRSLSPLRRIKSRFPHLIALGMLNMQALNEYEGYEQEYNHEVHHTSEFAIWKAQTDERVSANSEAILRIEDKQDDLHTKMDKFYEVVQKMEVRYARLVGAALVIMFVVNIALKWLKVI